MEVELLPNVINQSGTIVCGGGEMQIEVVEVPKKLSTQHGLCAKNYVETEGEAKQLPIEQPKFRPVKPQLWIITIHPGVRHVHPLTMP